MNRDKLKQHVNTWITRLGSQSKTASRIGISDAALSLWLKDKYEADTDKLDKTIAVALDYRESSWVVVPSIRNYMVVKAVFESCKTESLWMAISNKAGSGKTQTLKDLFDNDTTGTVIYIQAEEWTSRQFLTMVMKATCGAPKGYMNVSRMLDEISDYFKRLSTHAPILIIDEADKLKPAALRTLIPLYNRTEHQLGCILSGTENLEKEIKRGVRNAMKGYDEIDSRLGRTYIKLNGVTKPEAISICKANGIETEEACESIWNECEKENKLIRLKNNKGETTEKPVMHCEDLRRLMRLIKRELLTQRLTSYGK